LQSTDHLAGPNIVQARGAVQLDLIYVTHDFKRSILRRSQLITGFQLALFWSTIA